MFTTEQVQSLNELEMQVYQYVMMHKSTVPYMRIRELAAESFVSPTTVLRFCRKMGCDGYNEFKWKIKNEIGQEKADAIPEDLEEIRSFFDEIEQGAFTDKLKKSASLIAAADRIVFAGIGNSGHIAQYGARYFTNMGKFSLYLSDPFYPVNFTGAQNSLAILLSVSGETREILETVNHLKAADCTVISIVNAEHSTLGKLSDICISYHITAHRVGNNLDFSSQIPAAYLLESLGKRVRNRLAEE
ncbi:MAG: MurR/RpiR family transcriptional regulator [Lachnospiraceae bacterium]|nr:MurR/RpiR family transcriptional regulator [Lachnospiraceae bacterium]